MTNGNLIIQYKFIYFCLFPDILIQSTMLSSIHTTNVIKRDVDLYLEPPVGEFKVNDIHDYEKIIDIGYRYTLDMINMWKGLQGFKDLKI